VRYLCLSCPDVSPLTNLTSTDIQGSAGLVCLVGLKKGDTQTDAEFISRKILASRVFEDPESKQGWKRSVVDIAGEVLCVSQFTLYGRLKAIKPDFVRAMGPGEVCHQFKAPKPGAGACQQRGQVIQQLANLEHFRLCSPSKGWSQPSCNHVSMKHVQCISRCLVSTARSDNFRVKATCMQARQLYADFLQHLRASYVAGRVFDGEFGAMMDVALVNDGPVTCAAGHQLLAKSRAVVRVVRTTRGHAWRQPATHGAHIAARGM
jgi:D-Tyr-tRNAtyr deacylase